MQALVEWLAYCVGPRAGRERVQDSRQGSRPQGGWREGEPGGEMCCQQNFLHRACFILLYFVSETGPDMLALVRPVGDLPPKALRLPPGSAIWPSATTRVLSQEEK